VTPALATHELSKDYAVGFWRKRRYRALDRLTLAIEPGEVFGFLGPNGAGKTTTLKLLMQLVFPTSGSAEILGRPLGHVDAKRRIGYLPEQPYFYDYLTAEELVSYYAGLFGYTGAERRARVDRLLDEVGLGAERRFQLRRFSKGMLQRVGLAQALVNDPELVILDEPMSGLDPLGRRDVRALILRLRDRGCTVFFSSHVLSDAEALCERVAILAKGRLLAVDRVSGVSALEAQGWELVVSHADEAIVAALGDRIDRAVRIGPGRFALELPLDPPPDRLLAELTATGARLVSLNPTRQTLEDLFVRQITSADGIDRGLGTPTDTPGRISPEPRDANRGHVSGGRAPRASK
jgi:ABC-2 type transport system ATP-binding protein